MLEIAIGTGRNLEHYPREIRLTGIDFSASMLEHAKQRAKELAVDAELGVGDAQQLDLPDSRFDTVVSTLSLCSIPDERKAIREAKRVLRPGGRLLLLEHVASPLTAIRAIQTILDPIAVRFHGDHLVREPVTLLLAEGFEIEQLERLKGGVVERVVARKPAIRYVSHARGQSVAKRA